MGVLRLPGLVTGIDTTDLIKQLMAINSRRLATYKVQKMAYEDKSTVLNELRSKVSALETAAGAISDASKLGSYKASSSDTDILTVSASLDANPGSHSILINQLATTETWIHDDSAFSYETDYVGGGKFIYSYNHQERVITAVENETTLEDLVNLINDDEENPGVTASLLYQGGKYHLMLSGQETGQDYQISINASSTEVWKPDTGQADHTFTEDGETASLSTKITDLDQFHINGGLKGDEYIKISGENHFGTDISPDFELDVVLENTTLGHFIDAINEHFDGVAKAVLVNGQIHLTDHICGTSGMEISLSYYQGVTGDTELDLPTMAVSAEGGGTTADLTPFNNEDNFTRTQSAQNSEIKVNDYPTQATSEQQTLSTDASPTGGTYTLTFRGETTDPIAYSAGTGVIKSELEELPTVDTDDITVGGGATGLAEGDVTFTFISSLGDVSMISIDDTSLTGPTTTCSIVETIKGSNGWLNRNGNTIADALTGVTLYLHDVEVASPIEIALTRNISGVRSKVQGMVSAYNTLMTFLREKTEYDDQAKKMGILSTHLAVSLIKAQIRNPFDGVVTGFSSDDNFTQASDIGITVDGHGMLEFDTSEFNDAMSEDFMTALELIGVTATGHSDSAVIEFYAANDKYTTAGTYDVEVVVEEIEGSNFITDAKIKLPSESTWRDATINNVDSLITGDSTFDDSGTGPLYPENGLQLYVDVSTTGTFTATVRVKRGFAGTLEDMLTDMLDPSGRLDINEDINDDNITRMGNRIEDEEDRLEDVEERLIAKFTRLEKSLALLSQQFDAISTFGFGW